MGGRGSSFGVEIISAVSPYGSQDAEIQELNVAGMTPILLAVCILGSVQLFFIGFLGEYVLSINKRMMRRPLVIEEERINFTKNTDKTDRKEK